MHLSTAVRSFFATLLVLPAVFAQHDVIHARKNHAHRHLGEFAALERRTDSALFTLYDVTTGETACGAFYQNTAFVVALNSDQYTDGNHCNEQIIITIGSQTTTATIVDECPGCADGQLDLAEGLFEFFSPTAVGTLWGSWIYATDAPSSNSPPPSTPTPTPTPSPSPSPVAATPTWSPPPTSSSTSSSTSVSSSSSSSTSSSSVTPSPSPPSADSDTPGTTPSFDPGNLNQFNLALVGLADMVVVAASVH